MSKKYLLYADPSAGYARCAFYGSPTGCRNGEGCPFKHDNLKTALFGKPALIPQAPQVATVEDAAYDEADDDEEEEERDDDDDDEEDDDDSDEEDDDSDEEDEASNPRLSKVEDDEDDEDDSDSDEAEDAEVAELRRQLDVERAKKAQLLAAREEELEAERLREKIAALRAERARKLKELEDDTTQTKRRRHA